METVKSLFSFKGEISRGQMWITYLGVGAASVVVQAALTGVGQYTGDGAVFAGAFGIWPQTGTGWGLVVAYWLVNLAFFWIFIAAVVKRLRECGIARKWLGAFAILVVITGEVMERLTANASTIPSWQMWTAMIAMLPVGLMGLWLFGSVFLAPSHKPYHFDPSQLPDGWKK